MYVNYVYYVTRTNLSQRKYNEHRACALPVPNVRLELFLRSIGIYIHPLRNAHIFVHAVNVRRFWGTQ